VKHPTPASDPLGLQPVGRARLWFHPREVEFYLRLGVEWWNSGIMEFWESKADELWFNKLIRAILTKINPIPLNPAFQHSGPPPADLRYSNIPHPLAAGFTVQPIISDPRKEHGINERPKDQLFCDKIKSRPPWRLKISQSAAFSSSTLNPEPLNPEPWTSEPIHK